MRSKSLSLVSILCLSLIPVMLIIPACAQQNVAPTSAKPTSTQVAKAFQWPVDLLIGTTAVGGGSQTSCAALVPVIEKLTGMKTRAIPFASDLERIDAMSRKELDISDLAISNAVAMIEATGSLTARTIHGLDVIWMRMDTPWTFMVSGESEFQTIYDLKKKGKALRVTCDGSSEGHQQMTEVALAFLGLKKADVTWLPAGFWAETERGVVEGKYDVTLASTSSSITYEVESAPRGIRFLDFPPEDKEGWARVLALAPTALPGPIQYGVKSSLGHYGWTDLYLYWTMPGLDQEFTYQMAKWFGENYDAYKESHTRNARMSIDVFRNYLDALPFPVSEGTKRYLKEIGKWTAKDDQRNSASVELTAKYISTQKAAVAEAQSKKIAIAASNKDWVDLWNKYKTDVPHFKAVLD